LEEHLDRLKKEVKVLKSYCEYCIQEKFCIGNDCTICSIYINIKYHEQCILEKEKE